MTDTRDSFEKIAQELRERAETADMVLGRVGQYELKAYAGRIAALQSGAGDAHVVPAGWTLVPIEPSWDMRNEGREFLIDGLEKDYEKIAYFLWKTMVNASPKAPDTRPPAAGLAECVCTCPSGDGSLRYPCPKHPPMIATEEMIDSACEAYADMYDVEYIDGGNRDNRRACIKAALEAAFREFLGKVDG